MRQGSNGRRPRGRPQQKRHSGAPRHNNFDSSGPEGRVRGNARQVYEKYIGLARDAVSMGDRVAAETYYQHAEHYFRVLNTSTDPRSNVEGQPGRQKANGEIEADSLGGHGATDGQTRPSAGAGEQPREQASADSQPTAQPRRRPRQEPAALAEPEKQPDQKTEPAGAGEQPREQARTDSQPAAQSRRRPRQEPAEPEKQPDQKTEPAGAGEQPREQARADSQPAAQSRRRPRQEPAAPAEPEKEPGEENEPAGA